MFLATAGGDVQYARLAATEAVKAYKAQQHVDLLYIAQIIAFGLAILDSLNRSMADNLSVTQVLRLRSNAASLSRAADAASACCVMPRWTTPRGTRTSLGSTPKPNAGTKQPSWPTSPAPSNASPM